MLKYQIAKIFSLEFHFLIMHMTNKNDPFNAEQAAFLITIYETGAIAKSGEKFGLTPVASSRLLQKFRSYFKDPLFVVSKGRLLPTPFFLKTMPALQEIVRICSDMAEQPFDIRHCRKVFRFSCNPGFAPSMMAYVLPRIMEEAPQASVEHISLSSNPISALMGAEIDLLIGRAIGLPPQAHYCDLKSGDRCILLRKSHPLNALYQSGKITSADIYQAKRVSLSSGRRQDWISPDGGIFTGRNKNDNIVFKTDRAEMAWMAMTKTDLIQISTDRSSELALQLYPDLTTIPLPDSLTANSPKMSIIWSDTTHRDPAHRWFRSLFANWSKN